MVTPILGASPAGFPPSAWDAFGLPPLQAVKPNTAANAAAVNVFWKFIKTVSVFFVAAVR